MLSAKNKYLRRLNDFYVLPLRRLYFKKDILDMFSFFNSHTTDYILFKKIFFLNYISYFKKNLQNETNAVVVDLK